MNKFIAVVVSVCIALFALAPIKVNAEEVEADASDVEVQDVVFDTVIDIISDSVGADVPVSAYQDIKAILDGARSGSYNQTAEAVAYLIFDVIEQVMPVPLPDIVTTPLKNYLSDACADYLFPENPTLKDYAKRYGATVKSSFSVVTTIMNDVYKFMIGNTLMCIYMVVGLAACIAGLYHKYKRSSVSR